MPLLLAGLAGLCAWLRWSVVATLAFATYCLATALQAWWLLPLALVLRASTDADQVSS